MFFKIYKSNNKKKESDKTCQLSRFSWAGDQEHVKNTSKDELTAVDLTTHRIANLEAKKYHSPDTQETSLKSVK